MDKEKMNELALEIIGQDINLYTDIHYLTSVVNKENIASAIAKVSYLEEKRHDYIGNLFGEKLNITHPREVTITYLIDLLRGFLNLDDEECNRLYHDIDINKTPDAFNLSIEEDGTRILSIIDFKGRANEEKAKKETWEKYEETISGPIRRLGKCSVETIVIGINPKNGSLYNMTSKCKAMRRKMAEMLIDDDVKESVSKITRWSKIIDKVVDLYNVFPEFQEERHKSSLDIKPTEGHFTNSIARILDRLTERIPTEHNIKLDKQGETIETCVLTRSYDYNISDQFRLCGKRTNIIRIIGLFCEYYSMSYRDPNLRDELIALKSWFESSPREDPLHKAYRETKVHVPGFRGYLDAIDRQDVDGLRETATIIKGWLNNVYDDIIERDAQNLINMKQREIDEFKPREPLTRDFRNGLMNCLNEKIKVSNVVHTGECQQSFNFILPTSLNKLHVEGICRSHAVSESAARFYSCLTNLSKDVGSIRNKGVDGSISYGFRYSLIKSNENDRHYNTEFLKAIEIGMDVVHQRQCLVISKVSDRNEVSGFLSIIEDSFPSQWEPSDWDNLQKQERQNQDVEKGKRKLFHYNGSVSDGRNFCYGKERIKFMKGEKDEDFTLGKGKRIKDYEIRCGIGKKSAKVSSEMNSKDILVREIETLRLDTGDFDEEILKDERLNIIDTRPKLIDYRCIDCKYASNRWNERLKTILNTKNRFQYRSKLSKTIRAISNSRQYKQNQEAVENLLNVRLPIIEEGYVNEAIVSLSQLFEGLLVQTASNRKSTVSPVTSVSTDTILLRLPGEKLYNPKKTTPYIMISRYSRSIMSGETKKFLNDLIKVNVDCIDFILFTQQSMFIVSKPQRLDLNRINTLSKLECRYYSTIMTLFDTTMIDNKHQIDKGQYKTMVCSAFELAATNSISQMSIRDPLKYLFTLAIADTSDIEGFWEQKFNYHCKSLNDIQLFDKVVSLLEEIIEKRPMIKEANRKNTVVDVSDDGFLKGGWSEFKVLSPFTGIEYKNITQLVNEIFINVYMVQKELHNPLTNLEKLVEVPCNFEVELKKLLAESSEGEDEFNSKLRKIMRENDFTEDEMVENLTRCGIDRFYFCSRNFKNGPFSYNPDVMMLSARQRHIEDNIKATNIRQKIEFQEHILDPLVQIKTLTSVKSSTVCYGSKIGEDDTWNNLAFLKKHIKNDDILIQSIKNDIKNCNKGMDSNVLKAKLKQWIDVEQLYLMNNDINSRNKKILKNLTIVISNIKNILMAVRTENGQDPNEAKWMRKGLYLNDEGFPFTYINDKDFMRTVKFKCKEWIESATKPVKEAVYEFIKDLQQKYRGELDISKLSVRDVCNMKLTDRMIDNTTGGIVRMFPKGQRTFTDREIYIMSIVTKCLLYYVEHSYKHLNQINEYEAISVPGEQKSYVVANQEAKFLLKNSHLETGYEDRIEHEQATTHLNIDESKWSARDNPLKFVDCHFFAQGMKPSEKLMCMFIQFGYCKKIVCVPDEIMQRKMVQKGRSLLSKNKKNDPIFLCTNGLVRNYFYVTMNWLQGNYNYLSSFAHTSVFEKHKRVLLRYFVKLCAIHDFEVSEKLTNYIALAHSDDGTITMSVRLPKPVYGRFIELWGSLSRFVFYTAMETKKEFCITLNLLKTFGSEEIKDFISEFLVNGEFVANYARYIGNCCGDSTFSSYKEDIYMLMSAPQSMSRRGATIETLICAIGITNYHVYHTYSMATGEKNDPLSIIKEVMDPPLLKDKAFTDDMVKHMKALNEERNYRKEGSRLYESNRCDIPVSIGGYCTPPIPLLAVLGAKAHDAFILLCAYSASLTYATNIEKIATSENIMHKSVSQLVKQIRSDRRLQPSFHQLISYYFVRCEMGVIDGQFSNYDIERIFRVSILEFPKHKSERLPVTYASFRDYMRSLRNPNDFIDKFGDILKDPTNFIGVPKDTETYLQRTQIGFQIGRRIDSFQQSQTSVQRYVRLQNSNARMFMPVNLIDSVEKLNLKKSLKTATESDIEYYDQRILLVRSELEILKLEKKESERFRSVDPYDYRVSGTKMSDAKKRLDNLMLKRNNLRDKNIEQKCKDYPSIVDILCYITHKRTEANGTLQHTKALEYLKKLSIINGSIIVGREGDLKGKQIEPILTEKFTLGESLYMLLAMAACRSYEDLIESFIFSLIAIVFNDKMLRYYTSIFLSSTATGLSGKPLAKFQKVVYPYQSKQLMNRAEDVVCSFLMGDMAEGDLKSLKTSSTGIEDIEMIKSIVVELDLNEIVKDLQKTMCDLKDESDGERDIYLSIGLLKKFEVLYNVLLKAISLYSTKQAFILSRAKNVDVAFLFFKNVMGNFIKSNIYIEMQLDQEKLRSFNMNLLSTFQEGFDWVRKLCDACCAVVFKLQRLIGKDASPMDVKLFLQKSKYCGVNMWERLTAEETMGLMKEHITLLKGYIPMLYHLGLINKYDIETKIPQEHINQVWEKAHKTRGELIGEYRVMYSLKGLEVTFYGVNQSVEGMVINKDHKYTDMSTYGYDYFSDMGKILAKFTQDMRLKAQTLPFLRIAGQCYGRYQRGGLLEDFHIVEPEEDVREFREKEKRTMNLYFVIKHKQQKDKRSGKITYGPPITVVNSTVKGIRSEIVPFQCMGKRDILTLMIWDDPKYYLERMEREDNTEMKGYLHQPMTDFYRRIDNRDFNKYEYNGRIAGQTIIMKSKRAKMERFSEVRYLEETDILLNGLSLKTLLNSLQTVEESSLNVMIFQRENLRKLIPDFSGLEKSITGLANLGLESSIEEMGELIEECNKLTMENMKKMEKTVAISRERAEEILNNSVLRKVLITQDYGSLRINVIDSHPSSKISMAPLIELIITNVIFEGGYQTFLEDNTTMQERKDTPQAMTKVISKLLFISMVIEKLRLFKKAEESTDKYLKYLLSSTFDFIILLFLSCMISTGNTKEIFTSNFRKALNDAQNQYLNFIPSEKVTSSKDGAFYTVIVPKILTSENLKLINGSDGKSFFDGCIGVLKSSLKVLGFVSRQTTEVVTRSKRGKRGRVERRITRRFLVKPQAPHYMGDVSFEDIVALATDWKVEYSSGE